MDYEFEWNADALERLKRVVEASGTQKSLADKTGIPTTTMQKILTGKVDPGAQRLAKIASELGLSLDELLSTRPIESASRLMVPALVDERASAGDGSLVPLERLAPGPFSFNEEWIRRQFGTLSGLRLIQVAGDSQEPDLHDGDWIMIDQAKSDLRNGLYVIVLDDCLMLKRIQLEGKFVQLMSRNPIYSGIGIDLTKEAERLRIVGRAVYSFRATG